MPKVIQYVGDTESLTAERIEVLLAENPNMELSGTELGAGGLKSMDKERYYKGTKVVNLIECFREHKIRVAYFHNLSGDSEFITHGLINMGFKPINEPFSKPKENKTFTRMKDGNNSVYHMAINYDGVITELYCSFKLLNSSVADLGRDLGYPKGEIDYHAYGPYETFDEIPLEAKQYLERDIDIVIESLITLKKEYPHKAITASSMAIKDFKEHYGGVQYDIDFGGRRYDKKKKKYVVNNLLSDEDGEKAKKSYRGGLVGGDIRYKNQKVECPNGRSADYNSMYPSQQLMQKMPYGKMLSYKPKLSDGLGLKYIYISKGKLREGVYTPIIPSNIKTSKYYSNYLTDIEGEFYWVGDNELEMGDTFYELEYEILEEKYFRSKFVFTSGITEIKGKKENAPTPSDEHKHKIVQNGGYGKYGESGERVQKELMYDPIGAETGTRYGKNREGVDVKVNTENEVRSPVHVAAYITSCARVELAKALGENRGNVLYYDTDSVYCTTDIKGIKLHDRNYGAGKYEKKFTQFKYIKAKCYICSTTHKYKKNRTDPDAGGEWVESPEISRAIAGLSREFHSKINGDNFYDGAEFPASKTMRRSINGGLVLVRVKYTL